MLKIKLHSLRVGFHCSVIFTPVDKIQPMCERPRANIKVERGSNFYVHVRSRAFFQRTKVTVEIELNRS